LFDNRLLFTAFFVTLHLMIRETILGIAVILSGCSLSAADTNPVAAATAGRASLNVRDFGARADGKSKDTSAFQKALDACATNGGGTVVVPTGNYLIGSIIMGANTTLQLERHADLNGSPDIADYPIIRTRWEGEFAPAHRALISAENAANITIQGSGNIFGPPSSLSRLRNPRGPVLIEFTGCTNVVLDGFSTQYQQLWSIHPLLCRNVTARNLVIRSVNTNGDGLDVDSCSDVLIEHCNIDTGDDAISLKSGRGMEAVRIARPTENVVIRDCTLVSSQFGGIGLGTEMSGGIRNVRIENCFISGHQNGIFIKSRDGRGGYMENITGDNIVINNSPTFLGINLLNKGIQASEPVTGKVEKWANVRNLSFTNIRVENVAQLVAGADIPAEQPLNGLSLANVTGTCARGITLVNSVNVKLAGINVTGFQGPLVTTTNVQGTGLDDSSAPANRSTK
jgi:polygalacturonase